jgi:hypothetical protein
LVLASTVKNGSRATRRKLILHRSSQAISLASDRLCFRSGRTGRHQARKHQLQLFYISSKRFAFNIGDGLCIHDVQRLSDSTRDGP